MNSFSQEVYIGADEILKIVNCQNKDTVYLKEIEGTYFYQHEGMLIPLINNIFNNQYKFNKENLNYLLVINLDQGKFCLPANTIHEFEDVFVRPLNKQVDRVCQIYRGCCVIENKPFLILDCEAVQKQYLSKLESINTHEKEDDDLLSNQKNYLRVYCNSQRYLIDATKISFIVEKDQKEIFENFDNFYFRHLDNYNAIYSIDGNDLKREYFSEKCLFLLLEIDGKHSAIYVNRVLDLITFDQSLIEEDFLSTNNASGTVYYDSHTYQIIDVEKVLSRSKMIHDDLQQVS